MSVSRFVDERVLDCRHCSRSAISIDADLCSYETDLEPDADLMFILVIEKKCAFMRVCQEILTQTIQKTQILHLTLTLTLTLHLTLTLTPNLNLNP